MSLFVIGEKLYIGGGVQYTTNEEGYFKMIENLDDFWEYNFESMQWNQKKKMPIKTRFDGFINAMAATDRFGFISTCYHQLWKYYPLEDRWEELLRLAQGPYVRMGGTLISKNNDLYLIGGNCRIGSFRYDLNDIWIFDTNLNKWDLVTFYGPRLGLDESLIAASIFDNKILTIHSNKLYSIKVD
jgi:N-acetylneuraminic acid mutarotase